MKQLKNNLLVFITTLLLLNANLLQAGQAKFSIVPTNNSITSILISSNFTETVSYLVTNQTSITRTLTMVPMAGIRQIIGGGTTCKSPFTLAPQQSCSLSLQINGSEVPTSGINGGPVICKTTSATNTSPDPFLCSQPEAANSLAVSVTSAGQHAYVANQLGSSISVCQVNPATGLLSDCAVSATGLNGVEGIGFNPAGTFFYAANPGSNSISVCPVNQATGALGACVDSGGTGFNLDNAITFSPDGSILYTANLGGAQSVSACLVNASTGLLSACVNNTSPTFSTPSDMAVNPAGTFAYVANRGGNTISVCNVTGQTVNSCNNLSGNFISGPEGVTISADGLHIYIANATSNQIVVCDILQDGTGLLANCAPTAGQFNGTGNIGLNKLGTLAYVPNELLNGIFVCNVAPLTGLLSSCLPSLGSGFSGPAGVVLN